MMTTFSIGDHVSWNSEAGRVSGTIIRIHHHDFDYKGHRRRASIRDSQRQDGSRRGPQGRGADQTILGVRFSYADQTQHDAGDGVGQGRAQRDADRENRTKVAVQEVENVSGHRRRSKSLTTD